MAAHQVTKVLQETKAKYVESAKTDVLGALRDFRDLVPEAETYMFPDGKRKMAFKLKGTIPINYKGNVYNIPVSIYLWDTHPYYAPICFVSPTGDMFIKESEGVDSRGRVFLPYLSEWRFPGYDLNGLLQVMAMSFAERCPVYAKSKGGSSSASSASTQQPRPPSLASMPQPPYPTTPPVTSMPPYPNASGASPYQNVAPYPTNNSMGFSSPYMNTTPYPPVSNAQPLGSAYSQPARPAPPIPPAHSTNTIGPDHIKNSYITALEDKLRLRIREKFGTNYAELASIRETQNDLRQGQQKLRQMTDDLERQQKELESFIFTYQAKKAEFEKVVADCDGGSAEERSIDKAIDASTPLHRQLLLNYAQDLSCDDVIYSLGQALKKGTVTVQDYLKLVRDISRQQFVYRATMQKCRRTAGLPV